jgi:hypothetical protein
MKNKTESKNRYFIELQLAGKQAEVPRNREAEIRRAQAAQFIDQLSIWLHEQELNDKVGGVAITALGQVQITCEDDIISRLRDDDKGQIATIRQGATLANSIHRIGY